MSAPNVPQPSPIAILTGPTSGLGYALFEQLTAQAYSVVGLGRNLGRIAEEAQAGSVSASLLEIDFSESKGLEQVLIELRRTVLQTPPRQLVFISNAGVIEPIGQAIGLSPVAFERALRVNCLAPLRVAHVLTELARVQQQPLLILDISSGAANRPIRGWQAYCTSKAAYKMALDVLAAENPHVQLVHYDPGVMNTSMQKLIRQQQESDMPDVATFRTYQTEGMLKTPEEVATELIRTIEHRFS